MKALLAIAFLFIVIVIGNTVIVIAQENMKAPVAKKVPKVLKIHGYEITDNYAWLRDRSDKKNPEIIKYLEDNNKYTESFMGRHKGFVDGLYKEMLARIKQDDTTVPYEFGGWWYFTRTEEGKQYPTYLRSRAKDGAGADVLLDQNEMAKGYKYFAIGDFAPSDDGNMLAFATDTTGYRQYTLQIKDLRTGKILSDKIERVTSVEWSNDGKYLFVGQEDPVSKRSDKIWRHTVGMDQNELVLEEKDVLFNVEVGRSRDRQMLFIGSGAKTMDEYRYLSADDPTGEWRVLSARREGHQYNADFDNGSFYITTNRDGAENFKVMKAPLAEPGEKNWKDFIPYSPDVHIEDVSFFKGRAVVSEKENGLEYLRVIDPAKPTKGERIKTPESVYTMGMGSNPEYDTPIIRYSYASMITPNSTFEYDFKTSKSTLVKQQEIPSGYDKTQYETKRVWAKARDSVEVPILLIMKKGTKLDGSAPMLLYAYGSYGVSMNTFNDFVDSAKWLVANKYTSPDRLVIQGGSAGGLLMGAVVNQSPETFHAAIAQVPFVDVMNTMIDADLPLTTEEWIEWGNPRDDKKAWDYMVQYSPYENVKAQKYPNMLIETSLNDSQVMYWEGTKWAAKLREMNTGDSVILLKVNMGAGHGGSSGRYDRLKEIAFDYAYALTQVGIEK
jgi:oligopeptidase B